MLLRVLFLALTLVGCAGVTKQPAATVQNSALKNVILIHGSHLDSAAWQKVIPELSSTYQVTAVTLKGRDTTENVSLKAMAKDVCGKITSPGVIVGHGFGGVVANQMVGECPEKILQIVYVGALVPLKGEKPYAASVMKKDDDTLKKVAEFKNDRIYPRAPDQFFPGMDKDISIKDLPQLKLYSESYAPGSTALKFDEVVFEKIPKAYIYTEKDKIIPMEAQIKFTSRTAMNKTASVNSGHLPMLSKPQTLAKALKQVIQ